MNNKRIVVLSVLLAVALGIIILVNSMNDADPSKKAGTFFPGITDKTIGSVLIKDSQDWVKLVRKGDVWLMQPKQALLAAPAARTAALSASLGADSGAADKAPGSSASIEYPADSSATAQVIENIVKMKKRKDLLISESPGKQATFEVDSTKGNRIEVFDLSGKSVGAVILGKNGPDYSSVYCRAEGSNEVYQVLDLSKYAFGSDHKRWTDKSIIKFDKLTVKQLTIAKKDNPTLVIALGDSTNKGWQRIDPARKPGDTAALDSTKVDEVLSALSNLQAAEYEDSAYTDSAAGLADPPLVLSVTFKTGTTRTVAIGNAKTGQNKFWVKTPDKKFVYLINDSEQKKFDKKPEDFAKQPPAKPAEPTPKKAKSATKAAIPAKTAAPAPEVKK